MMLCACVYQLVYCNSLTYVCSTFRLAVASVYLQGKPIGQAFREDYERGLVHMDLPGEGCRIRATLLVNKVAGNVHIALGASHARSAKHVHQFMIQEMTMYNASHTIHEFSFGPPIPGATNPLTGERAVVYEGSAHFQYFIKVVPTLYTASNGAVTDSNQYSVTQQTHYITLIDTIRPDGRKIPGQWEMTHLWLALTPMFFTVHRQLHRCADCLLLLPVPLCFV